MDLNFSRCRRVTWRHLVTKGEAMKFGDSGEDVKRWQRLLNIKADGDFGNATEEATRLFQTAHRLTVDGIVGPKSWAAAEQIDEALRPPFRAITPVQCAQQFGSFDWTDTDQDGWITIKGTWVKDNIVKIVIPELDGVKGWKGSDLCHYVAAERIEGFFRDVKAEGKIHLVKSWGGCWAPRRIRTLHGFSQNLSMHAFGIAFDINVTWNELGQPPAPLGTEGSVVELLPIAYAHKLYWGGMFKDGMHFQAS